MNWIITAAVLSVFLLAPSGFGADTRVTRDNETGSYTRYDGTADAFTRACSTGRRSQWEPSVAIDPMAPAIVSIAANDVCVGATDGAFRAWPSLHRSTDGGQSWRSTLLPGYPGDGSSPAPRNPVHRHLNETGSLTPAVHTTVN